MTPRQPRGWSLAGAVLLAMMWAAPGLAQSGRELDDLRKELDAIKQGQSDILRELQALRTLILGAAARAGSTPRADVVVNVAGAPFLGNPGAPVTLVEFSDYQ